MKKTLLAFAVALGGSGCHHRYVAVEKYPPVFAPASPLAAYRSSQTGYPLRSPRASADPAFRDPVFAPSDGVQPDNKVVPASATEPAPPMPVSPIHEAPTVPTAFGMPGETQCPPPAPHVATKTSRVWVSAEWLMWATRGVGVPPLVTTGPATDPIGVAGAVGQPNTTAVFGNERMLNGLRSGLRVEVGGWFDDDHQIGAALRYFTLGTQSESLAGGANGTNVVAVLGTVPIYVGYPGLTRGTVAAATKTQFMGGDANVLHELTATETMTAHAFVGYRYLHLADRVGASFDVVPTAAIEALLRATARLMGEDDVRTRNNFHGGQVGLFVGTDAGPFTVALQTSVALGATVSERDVSRTRSLGASQITAANTLAALAGLSGATAGTAVTPVIQTGARHEEDFFAVVPEVGVKLGFRATDCVIVTAGYNFLYWNKVRRAQDQYDGSATLSGATTGFWAHGVGLGLDVRY